MTGKDNIAFYFFEVRVACGKSQLFSTMSKKQSMNINFKWDKSGSGGLFYIDGERNHLAMLYDIWSEGGVFNHLKQDTQKLMAIDAWLYAKEKLSISSDPRSISLIGHVQGPWNGVIYRSSYEDLNLSHEASKRGMSEYDFRKLITTRVTDPLPENTPTWDVSQKGFNWIPDFVEKIVTEKFNDLSSSSDDQKESL